MKSELKELWNEIDPGLKLGLLASLVPTTYDAIFAGPEVNIAERALRNALIVGGAGYGASKLKDYLAKNTIAEKSKEKYGEGPVGKLITLFNQKLYDNNKNQFLRWE